jgi:ribosome-associated protein
MSEQSPEEKVFAIVAAGLDRKAEKPVALNVADVTSFCDAFVLLTGRSDRQVRAIADGVVQAMKHAGDAPLGVEGVGEGRWVLIDCNDVICHVFSEEARGVYDLERLWADAKPIELNLPDARLEATGALA